MSRVPQNPGLRHPSAGEAPARRRKTPLACNRCREGKRKCDGVRPVCGACSRRNRWQECVFDDDKPAKGKDAESTSSLQERVRELECQLASRDLLLLINDIDTTGSAANPNGDGTGNGDVDTVMVDPYPVSADQSWPDTDTEPHSSHALLAGGVPEWRTTAGPAELPSSTFQAPTPRPHLSPRFSSPKTRAGAVGNDFRAHNDEPHSRPVALQPLGNCKICYKPEFNCNGHHLDQGKWMNSLPSLIADAEPDNFAYHGTTDPPITATAATRRSTAQAVHSPNAIRDYDLHDANQKTPSDDHSAHAIIGPTQEDGRSDGFFGRSSAGSFMQSVKRMVEESLSGGRGGGVFGSVGQNQGPQLEAPLSGHLRPTSDSSSYLPFLLSGHDGRSQLVDYVLPTRKRADGLLDAYFQNLHTLYPYLDKQQILEDYEKIWTGNGSIANERSFLCLLNVIFALSSQITGATATEIRKRQQASRLFYLRARELFDLVDDVSVRSVQSCLLLGGYFQTTNEPNPCWIFVGLGIRIAQSLGLHLPETSERVSDFRTRELLRRLWYGCVFMDRALAMTYGRPCMIDARTVNTVPLPLNFDQDTRPGGPTQSDRPSLMEFFLVSLKLFDILHDLLANLYTPSGETIHPAGSGYDTPTSYVRSSSHVYSSVFELERRMISWEQSLPNHLHIETYVPGEIQDDVLHRQAVTLHQKTLYVWTLLLRPSLSQVITSGFHRSSNSVPSSSSGAADGSGNTRIPRVPDREQLPSRISLQYAIVCVQVAKEAIDTVYTHKPGTPGDMGPLAPWWWNVLFLYTAATVLIAARLSPATLAEVSEESVLDRWKKAVELLEGFAVYGSSIPRLISTLRLLFDAVPHQYSQLRQLGPHGQHAQPGEQDSRAMSLAPSTSTQMHNGEHDDVRHENGDGIDFSVGYGVGATGAVHADVPWALPCDTDEGSMPGSFHLAPDGTRVPRGMSFPDLDMVFDPNDLSWLTTVPFIS